MNKKIIFLIIIILILGIAAYYINSNFNPEKIQLSEFNAPSKKESCIFRLPSDKIGMIKMSGTEYPKIYTLYERNPDHSINIDKLSRSEFGLINTWQVTEKLNGRNIRILLKQDGNIEFSGRRDVKRMSEQIPQKMMDYLSVIFTPEKMQAVFWRYVKGIFQNPEVCVYVEGLGSELATGSGIYCPGKSVSVRLIDCFINPWWIERPLLEEFGRKLGIKCTPLLDTIHTLPQTRDDLEKIIKISHVSTEDNNNFLGIAEGIVARTKPLLFNRKGERLMWKLKFKDFKG